jgi:hypothetical protein
MKKLSPQEAVIYLMVMVSASDREMDDAELARIGAIVRTLPAFRGFEQSQTLIVAQDCQRWLQRADGFTEILDAVSAAVPESAHDMVYALAIDIAIVNLKVKPEEVRLLQILRERLVLDRATVSAIERAAKARHRTF